MYLVLDTGSTFTALSIHLVIHILSINHYILSLHPLIINPLIYSPLYIITSSSDHQPSDLFTIIHYHFILWSSTLWSIHHYILSLHPLIINPLIYSPLYIITSSSDHQPRIYSPLYIITSSSDHQPSDLFTIIHYHFILWSSTLWSIHHYILSLHPLIINLGSIHHYTLALHPLIINQPF